MSYPPNGFNWNWTDLSYDASLTDVISTLNWIGSNLDSTFTPWVEDNFDDMYTNVEAAKSTASAADSIASAASAAASAASAAASAASTVADAAKTLAEWAEGKINRCSYLRGTH